jgi:N-acyl-D-amino-acid deacylase
VHGDQIAWLGRGGAPPARQFLPAEGLIVAPGFIDVHTHSDLSLLHSPRAEHKLLQGITTEVLGNCGLSVAPLPVGRRRAIQDYMAFLFGDEAGEDWPWSGLAEYLSQLEAAGPAVNALTLVAHGVVRLAVMGFDGRPAEPAEISAMEALVDQAMRDGAYGLSTGLQYPPGCYATLEELIQLARVAARHGGIYATHMRSQSTGLLESVRDSIRVGREAGLPVEISHLLASGEPNWGAYDAALARIDQARMEGLDVTFDMYPYTAGCTMLRVILPTWVMEGGNKAALERLADPDGRRRIREDLGRPHSDWDNISAMAGWHNLILVQLKRAENQHWVGKSLAEIAKAVERDPLDAALDLLLSEGMEGTMVAFVSQDTNVRKAVLGRYGMFGSDSLHTPEGLGMVHPRTYGAYPRYFAQYVREEGALRIEEAVRKATSTPAARFGLRDRGLLRPGMAADLVVFDLERMKDWATYQQPRLASEGVVHVLVNGVVELKDGVPTGERAGKVLRSGRQSSGAN